MMNKTRTIPNLQNAGGFALIAMMGVLAIVVIMATVMMPNMVTSYNNKANEQEDSTLQSIGSSSATYLRSTHTWAPSLATHAGYSPLDSTQLLQNDRLFPRYYALHPNMSSFSNGAGLAETALADARILLISNRAADAAPSISTGNDFETWWDMDESATPDLHIYRGNLASAFLKVSLSSAGNGGSFQVGGTTTNSSGATLATYERYHLPGTTVSFDEANTYGSPELQLTLTANLTFEFDPACEDGKKWHVPGVECGGEPAQFWVTTWGAPTGKSGVGTWNNDMMVAFGEPSLTFDSGQAGTTSGTFRGPLVDLTVFGASVVEALHFVTKDITIGSGANTVDLKAGDILASDIHDRTMTSDNSLFVEEKDVYVFRPNKPGDYSSGTFLMLFDGSDVGWSRVSGLTLVETATEVGGTMLQAGSFLMRTVIANGIKLFVPTAAGTTTSGSLSDFYTQDSLYAFELLETPRMLGDVTLQAGQILATTVGDGVLVGDNNLLVNSEDVFVLDLTGTGLSSAGDATLLFDGSDAGLTQSASSDSVVGITLSGTCSNWLLPIINPGFETGDLTGWTTFGSSNQWGSVTSSALMAASSSGTYFANGDTAISTAADNGLSQRIDISACATSIDTGELVIDFMGMGHGQVEDPFYDYSQLRLRFYDSTSGGNQLGSQRVSGRATDSHWIPMSISKVAIPSGTRSVEIEAYGVKNSGDYINAGVDSLAGRVASSVSLTNDVHNGGFENLSAMSGWTYTGVIGADGGSTISVVNLGTAYGISPPEGSLQAKLRTYSTAMDTVTGGSDNGNLQAFLGLTNAQFNTRSSSTIYEIAAIKQTFIVSTGSQLSFQWDFGTTETPGSGFNDSAFLYVTDQDGNEVQFVELASVQGSSFTSGGPGNHTGYQTTVYNFPSAGTYSVHIGVVESGDYDVVSSLLLDDVQITIP